MSTSTLEKAARYFQVAVMLFALVRAVVTGDPLLGFCAGGFLVYIVLQPAMLRTRYTSGWLEGRAAMVQSLDEAWARGMSPNEWLRAEVERDCARLGVPVPKIDTDEKDE